MDASQRKRRLGPRARSCAALYVLVSAACNGGPTAGSEQLEADEFVAVVVELRELERELEDADSAADRFEEGKAGILERHAVSEEQLVAFIEARGDDIGLMSAVWDTISSRLRHPAEGGTPPGLTRPSMDDTVRAPSADTASGSQPPEEPDSIREQRIRRLLVERPDSAG